MRSIEPRRSTVLLVDDDPESLAAMFADLSDYGCRVLAFERSTAAADALSRMARGDSPDPRKVFRHNLGDLATCSEADAIFTDIEMPYRDGLSLLTQAREQSPETLRYLLAGRPEAAYPVAALARAGAHGCFAKPWSFEEASAQLERDLARVAAGRERDALRALNSRNVVCTLDDLVRLTNHFHDHLGRFGDAVLAAQAAEADVLDDRLKLLAGTDAYHALAPVRDALVAGVKQTERFVRYLHGDVGAHLTQIISCLNFLQETADPRAPGAGEAIDYVRLIESVLKAVDAPLADKGVRWEAQLPASFGAVRGDAVMLREAWALLLGLAADLQPEEGRIFIREVVRMPEPPWEAAPYAPGHARMARCTPMTHAIVSIQGDVGVPEQECREAVEGLAAHMIAETMRYHGGCAVFADRGPTFEFTVAVLKQPVRAAEPAREKGETEPIRTS